MFIKPRHAAVIAAATVLWTHTQPAHAQAPARRFEIPPQPLSSALLTIGQVAGRNVVFAPRVVSGRRSAPVNAATFESAIAAALSGTGLEASYASDGTVTVDDRQDAATTDAPVLEDIVVTGDRPESFGATVVQVGTFRNARLIDAPATVNVIPRKVLESQGATGIYDALRNTAGVSRSETNGSTFDSLLIRGIQVDNRNSYKLNGTLAIVNLAGIPIENKERIEVLKGVGALYYGFAPPSGIVNVVTKRADRDVTQFVGSVNVDGGIDAAIDVGRRVTDRLGIRVNAVAGLRELGIDRYDGTRHLAAVALDWQATDAFALKVDFESVGNDSTETASVTLAAANSPLVPPAAPNVIRLPPLPSNRVNLGGENLRTDAGQTNILVRGDLKLSPQFALTLEGGQSDMYRDRKFASIQNYDLRPGANFGVGTLRVTRTERARFRNRHGRGELAAALSTGPIVHNLVAGGSLNERFQNGRAGTPVTVAQNYFDPIDIAVPDPVVFTESPNRIRDAGAYIFDRAELGPVHLLAGLRYSDYRSRTVSTAGVLTKFSFQKWSPSVGLVLKPARNVSVYGTYLQGLEEVSPAPNFSAFPNQVLPPATSQQYEAGVKAEVLSGLVLQAAGFRITRASAFVDPVDNVYKLAGRARFQGIEASATGEVTPELSVYLTGQYLNARIRRSNQAALLDRIPENTPEWTASAYAEYRPAIAAGLAIGGGLFYVGERPVNSLNQAFIGGYTTFSGSLAYTFANVGRGLTAQLTGDNLTDRSFWAGAGGNVLAVGAPRQVKLTIRIGL